jgi:hypothetical protein
MKFKQNIGVDESLVVFSVFHLDTVFLGGMQVTLVSAPQGADDSTVNGHVFSVNI